MNDSTNGYAGVDWATDAHAVCVVGESGQVIVEFDVAHTADGLGLGTARAGPGAELGCRPAHPQVAPPSRLPHAPPESHRRHQDSRATAGARARLRLG